MKKLFILIFLTYTFTWGVEEEQKPDSLKQDSDSTQQLYRVEKPGTITFTIGAKIKGKVEKPQVMIFLPKEKTHYRQIILERSFKEDLFEPLPFVPVVK